MTPHVWVLIAAMLLALPAGSTAEPPKAPPERLPVSPAEVAQYLQAAQEAEAWYVELRNRAGAARMSLPA